MQKRVARRVAARRGNRRVAILRARRMARLRALRARKGKKPAKKPVKKAPVKKKNTKVVVAKPAPKRCPCKAVQRANLRNARKARMIALRKRMAALKAARVKRIQQARLR